MVLPEPVSARTITVSLSWTPLRIASRPAGGKGVSVRALTLKMLMAGLTCKDGEGFPAGEEAECLFAALLLLLGGPRCALPRHAVPVPVGAGG